MKGNYMIMKTQQGKGIENCGPEFLHIDWSGKTQLKPNMKLWKPGVGFFFFVVLGLELALSIWFGFKLGLGLGFKLELC